MEKPAIPHSPLIEMPELEGWPVKVQVTWFVSPLRITVPPPVNEPSKRLRNSFSAAVADPQKAATAAVMIMAREHKTRICSLLEWLRLSTKQGVKTIRYPLVRRNPHSPTG